MRLDSPADLDSYETLVAAMERNYPQELQDRIMTNFRNNPIVMDVMGAPE